MDIKMAPASTLLSVFLCFLVAHAARAGSATWDENPPTNDWNTATNWTPDTVPNGPNDTATFNGTNVPDLIVHSDVELSALVFTDDLNNSETITVGDASTANIVTFILSGTGISNPSSSNAKFIQPAPTLATDGARNMVVFRNGAAGAPGAILWALGGASARSAGGRLQFRDDSTLGQGLANAIPGENGGSGGEIWFLDNSSASTEGGSSKGQLTASASGAGSTPGQIFFKGTSTASNAYISVGGGSAAGVEGGKISFMESSNAGDFVMAVFSGGGGGGPDARGGSAIFSDTASAGSCELEIFGSNSSGGATLRFLGDSSGGTAQVQLSDGDNAIFDISGHNPPGVTIGSLNGVSGTINLGANTLTIGSNNLTSRYSGLIKGRGSLTKIGTAALMLKGSNTYSGGTNIKGGLLDITNDTGSVTGTGPVNVDHATLTGNGTIAGSVNLFRGASLGPNDLHYNNLTIQGSLSFLASSAYFWRLDLVRGVGDQVLANGVTIASGTRLKVFAPNSGTLVLGTTFVVISNTSANPISGTFDNLPDGGVVTVKGNNLQANYEGGDGNDLTLAVVP